MANRVRSFKQSAKNGTWKRFGSTFGNNTVVLGEGSCTDQAGRFVGDNMPFSVEYYGATGGLVNTKPEFKGQFGIGDFSQFYCTAVDFPGMPEFPLILTYPEEKSSGHYASQTVARTTPSRPIVDVVANVLELRDLPLLIKSAGNTLIQQLAGNYLRYEFGIKPIVKDISELIDFTEQVNKKLETIQKLKNTGGFRKTVRLDTLSASMDKNITLISVGGCFIGAQFSVLGRREIRGHARYVPDGDYSRYTQGEMVRMAKRAVLGLEANFSGLWEGLPWTWLIDWCTNVGDLLMAQRNVIPATLSGVTLMRHTTSDTHIPETKDQYRTCSPITCIRYRKERYPAAATLSAQLPFLDGKQMGILASLLVMKQSYASR